MVRAIALLRKLFQSFYRTLAFSIGLLSVIYIALFFLVIVVAEDQLEIISLHHWLDSEENKYQQEYIENGIYAAWPNPYEFDSYWNKEKIPDWLTQYNVPGFYEHHLGNEDKHFLVTPHPSGDGLFYIVFKDDADDYLDAYENKLHTFTLLLGIIIIFLTFLYGVFLLRQFANPMKKVLDKIELMPPNQPPFKVEAPYTELQAIEKALLDSKNNISAYFQREQEFSRFASHEIRTPLMVLKGSADLLSLLSNDNKVVAKALNRINQACNDITLLTDMFLLLGREKIEAHHLQLLYVSDILRENLPVIATLYTQHNINYQLDILSPCQIQAPESFIKVVINNLMKNAFSYSDGTIQITLTAQEISVSNHYQPEYRENIGYGYGLIIIERICSRMNWIFLKQDNGDVFKITIQF